MHALTSRKPDYIAVSNGVAFLVATPASIYFATLLPGIGSKGLAVLLFFVLLAGITYGLDWLLRPESDSFKTMVSFGVAVIQLAIWIADWLT